MFLFKRSYLTLPQCWFVVNNVYCEQIEARRVCTLTSSVAGDVTGKHHNQTFPQISSLVLPLTNKIHTHHTNGL